MEKSAVEWLVNELKESIGLKDDADGCLILKRK